MFNNFGSHIPSCLAAVGPERQPPALVLRPNGTFAETKARGIAVDLSARNNEERIRSEPSTAVVQSMVSGLADGLSTCPAGFGPVSTSIPADPMVPFEPCHLVVACDSGKSHNGGNEKLRQRLAQPRFDAKKYKNCASHPSEALVQLKRALCYLGRPAEKQRV